MNKFILWLNANKWLNVIILCIYYLLVVLPHEKFGVIIAKLFEGTSREYYNLITLLISLVLFSALFVLIFKRISLHRQRTLLMIYFTATALFVVLCFTVLFVMNIESIHFFQYGCFAILCYPLIGSYFQTLVFSTIAGAFDEAYQYFYLAPQRTDYFDWNDVIINIVGASLGLLVLKTLLNVSLSSIKHFFQSSAFYFLCLLVGVCIVLFSFNILSVYIDFENPSQFTLVKVLPEGFWSYPPGPYVKYHVIMPLEGLLIIGILWLFYYRLDYNK